MESDASRVREAAIRGPPEAPDGSYRSIAMSDALKKLEHAVMVVIASMMALVVVLSVLELGWIIATDIISPPVVFLGLDELFDVFGAFFVVLIGLELLDVLRGSRTRSGRPSTAISEASLLESALHFLRGRAPNLDADCSAIPVATSASDI